METMGGAAQGRAWDGGIYIIIIIIYIIIINIYIIIIIYINTIYVSLILSVHNVNIHCN